MSIVIKFVAFAVYCLDNGKSDYIVFIAFQIEINLGILSI